MKWIVLLLFVAKSLQEPFGHSLLPLFPLEKGYVNLNHGSFGSAPLEIHALGTQASMHMEANTDRFFRYEMYQKVDVVRSIVANHVSANEEDIVFVINASHGVNAILRSLLLPSGSKFLYFNLAYTMVKNTLYYISEEFQNQLVEVNVTFPVSYAKIVGSVVEALEQNPEVKVACFSHITSVPALILPIKELTEECHKRGVMVLVDGAHAMGQIPINITDLGADFYLSNGHKWFYTLKGSAFLWVKKELQPLISPTVISFEGEGATRFQVGFSWEGTMDYSPYLSFEWALQFRQRFGDKEIMDYMHGLAESGGKLLAQKWGTDLLVDPDMFAAMVNVRLPSTNRTDVRKNLPKFLLEKYNTWVPVFPVQDYWYTRVSAQIYNEISDFEVLANAVLDLLVN